MKDKLRHARKLNEYFVNFAYQHIEISLLLIDLIYFDFKIYRVLITMFLVNFENKVFLTTQLWSISHRCLRRRLACSGSGEKRSPQSERLVHPSPLAADSVLGVSLKATWGSMPHDTGQQVSDMKWSMHIEIYMYIKVDITSFTT